MRINRSSIIVVSLFVEGFLAILFFVWASLNGFSFKLVPEVDSLLYGVVGSIPLFIVSFVFFGPLANHWRILFTCRELREAVVRPLANQLTFRSCFIIAACAGFGEELFFRGLMLNELGIALSSLLFALIHFGFAARHYWLPAILYFLIGLYFCHIATTYGLWAAITTHFLYDFVALAYMKREKVATTANFSHVSD